jgi:hypothetical protein
MSGAGFHVHGPHDHELEHAAQHGDRDVFSGQIAVTTAVLATIDALCAYMGGATRANAGLYKNSAAIKKTEVKTEAHAREADAQDWAAKSDYQMHLHHRRAQSTTALQISIALAAIALLTRRKWLEWGMFGVPSIGLAPGAAALMHV